MTLTIIVLGALTVQRLGELKLARRNTRELVAQGAYEVGAGHYPLVVSLHAAWLVTLWVLGWDHAVRLPWLSAFILLQVLRVWVIASLGRRWTTRIIILPRAPLIRRGPYRYLSHPNYALVIAEIAVLPMMLGLVGVAVAFSLLNGLVLFIRIRAETRALAPQRGGANPSFARTGDRRPTP